ncbi:MAG: hypothetical protein DMG92_00745 [Acidobacteria bacterium]|nr:MAG: hypothetical protein DMG92_00745 [Acidobacteriota bacterium]
MRTKGKLLRFSRRYSLRSSINPITDGWLNRFLLAVTEEERSMWASSVYRTLSGMKEAAVESAWSNWIESYWQNRIDGVPVPLERPETGEMLHWCLLFKASFPNAADKMYRSPIPRLEHSFLHHDLSGSDLPQRHPVAVAHFVNYLLRNSLIPAYHFEPVANIITKIRPFVEARNELLEICNGINADLFIAVVLDCRLECLWRFHGFKVLQ